MDFALRYVDFVTGSRRRKRSDRAAGEQPNFVSAKMIKKYVLGGENIPRYKVISAGISEAKRNN